MDLESHAVARKLDDATAIVSNDLDHVLISLAFENPKTIIVRKMSTTNKVTLIDTVNARQLLQRVPSEHRQSVMMSVILTGTDTCQSVGISPTKTAKLLLSPRNQFARVCPRKQNFEIDVFKLRRYISDVLIISKKKQYYTFAREAERFYLFFPFWTLVYMHGHTPPDHLLVSSCEENMLTDCRQNALYFPHPGALYASDFWGPIRPDKDFPTLSYSVTDDDGDTSMDDETEEA